MACDFLQGLDIDALSPPEGAVDSPVLLVDGLGGAAHVQLFPKEDSVFAGRIRRCPARASNRHWDPQSVKEGFAQRAIDEFRHFWQAKLDGVLAHDLRFVVALPTPYTLLSAQFPEAAALSALPEAERSTCNELAVLFDTLPADQLVIQWDVCGETRVWETRGRDLDMPRGLPERLLESFVRICEAVPSEAELGFHFCHRGTDGESAVVPGDSGQVSRLIGAIIASTERYLAYVHVPVPADREDRAYFEPLANLALWPSMEVHLGLLHGDGVAAAQRRLDAAQTVLRQVGLAPACGVDPVQILPQLAPLLLREPTTPN